MDTKEKIVHTIVKEMAKKPLEEIVIRDIAAKAKVNVAAINYHFGSKEKLFTEAINRFVITNLSHWLHDNLNLENPTQKDLASFLLELHYNTIAYRNFSRTKIHHLVSSEQPDEPNRIIFETICRLMRKLKPMENDVPMRASILFNSLMSFSISPETAVSNAGFGSTKAEIENYIHQLLKIVLS